MLRDFVSFVSNVVWLSWVVVTGFVLNAESIARYFCRGYDEWAAKYVTATHRNRVARYSALTAFILANFLAYHSSQVALRTAQKQIESLKSAQGSISEAVSVEATGESQATATSISAPYNIVISATPGGGVILRPSSGIPITVKNTAPSDLLVYPPEGAAFDGQSVNKPVSIYRGDGVDTFVCVTKVRCIP